MLLAVSVGLAIAFAVWYELDPSGCLKDSVFCVRQNDRNEYERVC